MESESGKINGGTVCPALRSAARDLLVEAEETAEAVRSVETWMRDEARGVPFRRWATRLDEAMAPLVQALEANDEAAIRSALPNLPGLMESLEEKADATFGAALYAPGSPLCCGGFMAVLARRAHRFNLISKIGAEARYPHWAILEASVPGDASLGFAAGALVIVGFELDATRWGLTDRDGFPAIVASTHPMREPVEGELA